MRVLLSGAGGFVGSHVLRHLLMNTDATIVAPVTFRHKGLPERIESSICDNPEWVRRVDIPHWDMTTMPSFSVMHAVNDCDVFMNIASESHVDRSIKDPVGFTTNNVQLIQNLIEVAKLVRPEIILQMSTDEVYGPAPEGYAHKEWDPIIPSNPYSASKAMQEAYCIAAWRTFGLPIVITNTMNIIGELQSPEKFVPMIIRNLRDDRPIAVHCAPDGTPGSRFYLHARNLADAEMVQMIGSAMGKRPGDIQHLIKKTDVHSQRPGHDLRYALDGTKIKAAGWFPPVALDASLKKSVEWTLDHPEWLDT